MDSTGTRTLLRRVNCFTSVIRFGKNLLITRFRSYHHPLQTGSVLHCSKCQARAVRLLLLGQRRCELLTAVVSVLSHGSANDPCVSQFGLRFPVSLP